MQKDLNFNVIEKLNPILNNNINEYELYENDERDH